MNKSKTLKIAIGILSVIVIIIIIILIMLKKTDSTQIADPPQYIPEDFEINQTIEEVTITNDYFIIKNTVDTYYSYLKELNTTQKDLDIYRLQLAEEELQKYIVEGISKKREIAQEAIYNMLDSSYITEFNITKENIQQKFGIQNKVETVIEKMYVIQNSLNVSTYFVSGAYIDTETLQKVEFNMAVSLDMLNNTFSIYPQEYLEKHGYQEVNVGDKVEINIESIENKNYNTFEYKFIEDDTIAMEYFNNYKYTMLYNTDKAYEMLDQEYREKRFGSLEEYKQYVQQNYNSLSKCIISKYQVEKNNGVKNYICLDNFENYYIFKQNSISNYTLILDTYTIDLPEFTEKYNSGTDQQKVALNINKFMQAINNKDYKYAYNCLADSFKNNYFKTQAEFENYAKENFYTNSNVEYNEFDIQGDVYTYSVILTDKETGEQKNKTFIMQLGEGTEFVLSFDR